MKKIVLDGLQVDLTDADAVAVAISKLQDKAATAETALADANAKVSEANGKIAALDKMLADAKAAAEPAALDKRVADRAALIASAKAAHAAVVTDGKTDAEIRRAVVDAKMGDAAKDMDDSTIAGAFAALATVKADDAKTVNLTPNTAAFADTASVRDFVRAARY